MKCEGSIGNRHRGDALVILGLVISFDGVWDAPSFAIIVRILDEHRRQNVHVELYQSVGEFVNVEVRVVRIRRLPRIVIYLTERPNILPSLTLIS